MDPVASILMWIANNWFALAIGAAIPSGIVQIKNIFAK